MRADIQAMLEKQAAWQRSRADKSWAEKLRACVALRRGLTHLKKQAPAGSSLEPRRQPESDQK